MSELKRLLNKKFLIVLLVMIVANMCLFVYQQLEGKSFTEIVDENSYRQQCIKKYSQYEPANAKELLIKDNQALSEAEKDKYRLVTKEIRIQLTYLSGFESELSQIQANAERMQKFSIFANKESFSYNNIIKTAKDFKRLEGIELKLTNDKAVAEFTGYYYTFYIAMGLMLLVIYSLFSERENGMWDMVHTSAGGRARIGIVRGLVLLLISMLVTAGLYFTTLVVSLCMYGGVSDLLTPIQTISEYGHFTYIISKLEYVFVNFLFSWLAVYALSMVLWMLFTICRKRNHALVIAGVFFGAEALLYNKISVQSAYALLKQINVTRLFSINEILGSYENRGWGTFVVAVSVITLVVLLVMTIASYAVAVIATVKMRPEQKKTIFARIADKLWMGYQKIFAPMPVMFKEFHKLLVTAKGFAVMVAMLIIAVYFASNGKTEFSDSMKERDEIYLTKGGSDYSQIQTLVDDLYAEYDEATAYAMEMSEKYKAGEIDMNALYSASSNMEYCDRKLKAVEEFVTKMDYLDRIEEEYGVKGYLISDRGYESIFGKYGQMRELILLIVLVVAVMLIISEVSLLESRTGMESMLHSSVKGRQWLTVRKVVASVGMATLLFVVVYGIDYIQMMSYYGMPYPDAPIMSLTFMEGCKFDVTIAGWIVLRLLVRYIVVLGATAMALASSKLIGKKGNRAVTIILLIIAIVLVVALERSGVLL